jgi:hypothetical protein
MTCIPQMAYWKQLCVFLFTQILEFYRFGVGHIASENFRMSCSENDNCRRLLVNKLYKLFHKFSVNVKILLILGFQEKKQKEVKEID